MAAPAVESVPLVAAHAGGAIEALGLDPWGGRFDGHQPIADIRKQPPLPLEILDEVGGVMAEEAPSLSEESKALSECVQKLPESDRTLLRSRYQEGTPLSALASRVRQSLAAVNMRLVRIRKTLMECARKSMADGA